MRYDVYLGDATIYGVSEVEENANRALGIHNGLGQGNFVLGGDRELRRFALSCELSEQNSQNVLGWSPAKNLFGYFERLLEESSPLRLIIVSEHSQVSLPVLLESYTKTEAYAGVYTVGIKLIEYRACAMQSADVPYVKRPGKLPVVIADKIMASSKPAVGKTNDSQLSDKVNEPLIGCAREGVVKSIYDTKYKELVQIRMGHTINQLNKVADQFALIRAAE